MRYAVIPRSEWNSAIPVYRDENSVVVDEMDLGRYTADALQRNPLAHKSVRDRLRREGRVFLAGKSRSAGLIVEQVPNNVRIAGIRLDNLKAA